MGDLLNRPSGSAARHPRANRPEVRPARASDLTAILALLAANDLPEAGLRSHIDTTLVVNQGADIVGCAALELYGASALLRSVAVRSDRRGRGLGELLTRASLDLAAARGVDTVYLLTETAEGFFPRFGFDAIDRSAVRPEVRQSVEFTSACPESATAMVLRLDTAPARR